MNIYDMVTDRIINKLEEAEKSDEKFHWVKPFDITEGVRFACNYKTQIPYSGINKLLAEPDEYLTFNQIKKMNDKNKDDFLKIRKNSKGVPILYVNWKEVLDTDGNEKTDKDGIPIKKPFFKYYTVFSRQDIINNDGENLPSKFPTRHYYHDEIEALAKRELLRFTSMVNNYCSNNGIELQFVNDGTRAYFSPTDKVIRIPNLSNFNSIFEFVSTLAHETIHSTMLLTNRVPLNEFQNRENYSHEELVAEIGSAMLVAQFQILDDSPNKDNDISYISGWRKFIKDSNTKGVIIGAAQHGQKACDLILDSKLRMKILEDIKEKPEAYENAPDFMKMDFSFVKEATDINPLVWDFVTEEIKSEINGDLNEDVSVEAKDSFYFLDYER